MPVQIIIEVTDSGQFGIKSSIQDEVPLLGLLTKAILDVHAHAKENAGRLVQPASGPLPTSPFAR